VQAPVFAPGVLHDPVLVALLRLAPAHTEVAVVDLGPLWLGHALLAPVTLFVDLLDPTALHEQVVGRLLTACDWPVVHNLEHHLPLTAGSLLPADLALVLHLLNLLLVFHLAGVAHPVVASVATALGGHHLELRCKFAHEEGVASVATLVEEGTIQRVLDRQGHLVVFELGLLDAQSRLNHVRGGDDLAGPAVALLNGLRDLAFLHPSVELRRQVRHVLVHWNVEVRVVH